MSIRPLKILLLGDASNCHAALAKGLRELGHDVTLVSDGSGWMGTGRDIDISRSRGLLGGLRLWLKLRYGLKDHLAGYDVVSLHSTIFVQQRPVRNRLLLDYLSGENRAVFYTALGTDVPYIEECLDPHSPLRYNEWRVGTRHTDHYYSHRRQLEQWLAPHMRRYHDYFFSRVAGATPVLYEYDVSVRRALPSEAIQYCGLPIDWRSLRPVTLSDDIRDVNIFLGRHRDRMTEKGTHMLEAAARRVAGRHPGRCHLTVVENRPYDEYLGLLKSAHISLDQAYSYTPAVNALLSMAYGLNVVSGGEPDYYDFIGEHELRPVINALPDTDALTEIIDSVVTHPEELALRGRQSREFVAKHHDPVTVAGRFADFWQKRLYDLRL